MSSDKSESVGRATTRGALWFTLQSVSARVFNLLSQLVLAWLLVPADFGLIGLAYTVTIIVRALVSFGVEDVLLQRQRAIRLWETAAFWVSLGLALIGMLLMLIAAPIGAALYHSPKLVGLIAILAVAMPIGALSTVPGVVIRARMGFRYLALYNTFEIAATQVLTIVFALCKFGAYSFALPLPILMVVKAVLFWTKSPPHLKSRLRRFQLVFLVRRGSARLGTQLLIESVSQGDYVTLGVLASHAVVGSYYFAFRLASQPLRILAGNFSNVLFPAFALLNGQPERQAKAAISASQVLAYIVMPFCFMQAALAGPLLRLWFGSKWLSTIPLMQALSIGLPFDAMSWIAGALMAARGEFRRQLVLTTWITPLFFALVLTGAFLRSALGVAWAVTIYYAVTGPIYTRVAFSRSGVSAWKLLSLYIYPPLIAGTTIGAGYLLGQLAPSGRQGDLERFAIVGGAGSTLYYIACRLFAPHVLQDVFERLGVGKLQRRIQLRLQRQS